MAVLIDNMMNLLSSLMTLTPSGMDSELLFEETMEENIFMSRTHVFVEVLPKSSMNEIRSSAPRRRKRDSINKFNHDVFCQKSGAVNQKEERRLGILMSVIDERLMRNLREKEEEIDRMEKLNWDLEERIQNLFDENRILKDVVESNELTVCFLRSNLEQLIAQISNQFLAGTLFPAEDSVSSCASPNNEPEPKPLSESECGDVSDVFSGEGRGEKCRYCWGRESTILALPCRHLCLCTLCGSTRHICPRCDSHIQVSIPVNF